MQETDEQEQGGGKTISTQQQKHRFVYVAWSMCVLQWYTNSSEHATNNRQNSMH